MSEQQNNNLNEKQKEFNDERIERKLKIAETARKIREQLNGREHSDSVELLREDRQR